MSYQQTAFVFPATEIPYLVTIRNATKPSSYLCVIENFQMLSFAETQVLVCASVVIVERHKNFCVWQLGFAVRNLRHRSHLFLGRSGMSDRRHRDVRTGRQLIVWLRLAWICWTTAETVSHFMTTLVLRVLWLWLCVDDINGGRPTPPCTRYIH